MMKRIPLTKGKEALVDDQDYECVSQFRWHTSVSGVSNHAARKEPGSRKTVYMHQLVASLMDIPTGVHIDHKDTNGLNNCRDNLRQATHRKNLMNRGPQTNNTSGFKGVYLYRGTKWRATITVKGKNYHIGNFDDKVEAAKAYNTAAKKHFGEFAWLNPIPGED
jgi:hypothetical protein